MSPSAQAQSLLILGVSLLILSSHLPGIYSTPTTVSVGAVAHAQAGDVSTTHQTTTRTITVHGTASPHHPSVAPVAVAQLLHGSSSGPATILAVGGHSAAATGHHTIVVSSKTTFKPVLPLELVTETPNLAANVKSRIETVETVMKTPISQTVSHVNGNKTITTTTYKVVTANGHHNGSVASSAAHSGATASTLASGSSVGVVSQQTTAHPATIVTTHATVHHQTATPATGGATQHVVVSTAPVKSVIVHAPVSAASASAASSIMGDSLVGSPLAATVTTITTKKHPLPLMEPAPCDEEIDCEIAHRKQTK